MKAKIYLDQIFFESIDTSKFPDTWDLCVYIQNDIASSQEIKFYNLFINNKLAYPDNVSKFDIKSIKRIDINKMSSYYTKSGERISDADAHLNMSLTRPYKKRLYTIIRKWSDKYG